MENQTIKRMNKGQCQQFLEKTIENANIINSSVENLQKSNAEIEKAKIEIVGGDENIGLIDQIKKELGDIKIKSEEIDEAYDKICTDTEEEDSIATQLEGILDDIKKNKEKIENFEKKILGYKKKNDIGETEDIPGLSQKLDDLYNEQKKRYSIFYKKIEQELKAGVTSVNLSKSFADKVGEYHKDSRFWSKMFVGLSVLVATYYGYITVSAESIHSYQDVILHLAFRAPFLAFVIWLGIFFGNRRAESKKLEESYKHKEVLARSFVGYKETIEEISDEDSELLIKHMQNLLDAMNINSSEFLATDGEKHPIMEFTSSFFRGSKKNEE
ncbi:MAG: hypothetical protein PHW24_01025 [Candidatus Moranbacteria bacterium]|nr:hypothetical protein [Candidatus Moranbacteria bacterium]